jgi:hypothetical protein
MELIASQETGRVMFHRRDDVLCWFWFLDYFSNLRTVSSGSLSKNQNQRTTGPGYFKTLKRTGSFQERISIYGQRLYVRLFEKNSNKI